LLVNRQAVHLDVN